MTFDQFVEIIKNRLAELQGKGLKANVSEAQLKILKFLFDQGDTFPKQWVPRDVIHALIDQSDYRRRISELVNDIGIDIQLESQSGTYVYRLNSPYLNDANPRAYLSAKNKNSLFIAQNYTCQVCGSYDLQNTFGTLQADHKVPLSRGGSNNIQNWQTLCYVCNVGKRRACHGCSRNCSECVWAFPEHTGVRMVTSLTPNDLQKLGQLGIPQEGISDWISSLIRKEIDK
ncbi:TPA: HNH endonuclease [Enterobacter hormaechei subsp. xiangfangensis]